jgi:hypothetical protein
MLGKYDAVDGNRWALSSESHAMGSQYAHGICMCITAVVENFIYLCFRLVVK